MKTPTLRASSVSACAGTQRSRLKITCESCWVPFATAGRVTCFPSTRVARDTTSHQSRWRDGESGLGRHLAGSDRAHPERVERRDLDSHSDPQLQSQPARMALQRPAKDSAEARNRSMGVSCASVSGHANEPRRADHRAAEFNLGRGLTVRPAVTTGGGVPAPDDDVDGEFQPSLDVTQRLGANVVSSRLSTRTLRKPKSTRGARTSRGFHSSFPRSARSSSRETISSGSVSG